MPADQLNCMIGGRGSGKSTVVEYLRFALGRLAAREREAVGEFGNRLGQLRWAHGVGRRVAALKLPTGQLDCVGRDAEADHVESNSPRSRPSGFPQASVRGLVEC